MDTYVWYQQLKKPFFSPPAWIFGPVWSVLYVLIIVSFGFVFYKVLTRQWPVWVALPFLINIIANLIFTYLQFGLKNNVLALLDIIVVLTTILWAMRIVPTSASWVAWIQVPYLLWVSFATILQATITWMNR